MVITDPTTNAPFAGNIIPQSQLSPAATNLLKYSPVPAADGYDHWRVNTPGDYREYISRLDYRLSERHSFTARYYQNDTVNSRGIDPNDINTVSNSESTYAKNGTLGYTFVASPSLLSDTRVTVARTFGIRSNAFPKTIADMGVDVHPTSNQISVSINGTSGLSLSTSNPPARFARTNLELQHTWTLDARPPHDVVGRGRPAVAVQRVQRLSGLRRVQFQRPLVRLRPGGLYARA